MSPRACGSGSTTSTLRATFASFFSGLAAQPDDEHVDLGHEAHEAIDHRSAEPLAPRGQTRPPEHRVGDPLVARELRERFGDVVAFELHDLGAELSGHANVVA